MGMASPMSMSAGVCAAISQTHPSCCFTAQDASLCSKGRYAGALSGLGLDARGAPARWWRGPWRW